MKDDRMDYEAKAENAQDSEKSFREEANNLRDQMEGKD